MFETNWVLTYYTPFLFSLLLFELDLSMSSWFPWISERSICFCLPCGIKDMHCHPWHKIPLFFFQVKKRSVKHPHRICPYITLFVWGYICTSLTLVKKLFKIKSSNFWHNYYFIIYISKYVGNRNRDINYILGIFNSNPLYISSLHCIELIQLQC